ncbi:MAG: diphosphomevalonate decarboxylase, partial [Gammaproteobacteria bacterium]|nr:diphosphomevalonate decarboxylase [Gammaproteobacteria bacterium]
MSATLDTLTTTTTVEQSFNDLVVIDGKDTQDGKIKSWLRFARSRYEIPPVCIRSESNFPASSGLASSASGFAALAMSVNQAFGLGLEIHDLANLARIGSASAARSMLGGFVSLKPNGDFCVIDQLHPKEHWALRVVVAITDPGQK